MALTEHGLGVADGVRGRVQLDPQPGEAITPLAPALTEDGECPRSSGRPDLYPHAPQHRGASHALAGRLDEVLAPTEPASPPGPAAVPAAAATVPAVRPVAPYSAAAPAAPVPAPVAPAVTA